MPRLAVFSACALAALSCAATPAAVAKSPVTLDVQFRLTDLEYRPIAAAPVRLTFGSDRAWQHAGTGESFVTDAQGAHHFTTTVAIDQQQKKLPTNFADSLTSRPQPTDHLLVAAELQYAGFSWLYAIDVFRFPIGGDVLTDGVTIYTRDASGNFTRKAIQDRGGWHIADLNGLVLTNPGHEAWNWMLQPDGADPTRWKLDVSIKRAPAPVRR